MAGRKPAGGKPVEVQALEPIKSGGKRHDPGAFVTVPSGQAEELFALGHARPKAEADAEAQAQAEAEAKAKAEAEAKAAQGAGQGSAAVPPAGDSTPPAGDAGQPSLV